LLRKNWTVWSKRLLGWALLVPCAAIAFAWLGEEKSGAISPWSESASPSPPGTPGGEGRGEGGLNPTRNPAPGRFFPATRLPGGSIGALLLATLRNELS